LAQLDARADAFAAKTDRDRWTEARRHAVTLIDLASVQGGKSRAAVRVENVRWLATAGRALIAAHERNAVGAFGKLLRGTPGMIVVGTALDAGSFRTMPVGEGAEVPMNLGGLRPRGIGAALARTGLGAFFLDFHALRAAGMASAAWLHAPHPLEMGSAFSNAPAATTLVPVLDRFDAIVFFATSTPSRAYVRR
jgi:hypothetical protein